MSSAHIEKDDGQVHSHISSTPFYTVIFLTLVCLTILTVGQSYVDLGKLNLIVVIAIATTKAALVVSFFMHLRYDNKFNALIFISCLFFVGIFFTYTMNDTEHRGEHDPDQNVHVLAKNGETAPGGFVAHVPDSAEHSEHGAAPGASGEHAPAPPTTGGAGGAEHH